MIRDDITTNSPLNKLKFTEELFSMMWEVKKIHLEQIWGAYGVTEGECKEILYKLLKESNMNTGACNVAVGFIIESISRNENDKESVSNEIRNQILNSAIYYANGLGLDPN